MPLISRKDSTNELFALLFSSKSVCPSVSDFVSGFVWQTVVISINIKSVKRIVQYVIIIIIINGLLLLLIIKHILIGWGSNRMHFVVIRGWITGQWGPGCYKLANVSLSVMCGIFKNRMTSFSLKFTEIFLEIYQRQFILIRLRTLVM